MPVVNEETVSKEKSLYCSLCGHKIVGACLCLNGCEKDGHGVIIRGETVKVVVIEHRTKIISVEDYQRI